MREIGELLASPPSDVTLVERTLTDGYAAALTLEAERSRLQKQLGAVVASMEQDDARRKSRALSELAREVERADHELATLRVLLVRLRGEYTALIETAAAARPRRRGVASRGCSR
jgi:septal ring factor EnvC (AmiA/AmiB activator)